MTAPQTNAWQWMIRSIGLIGISFLLSVVIGIHRILWYGPYKAAVVFILLVASVPLLKCRIGIEWNNPPQKCRFLLAVLCLIAFWRVPAVMKEIHNPTFITDHATNTVQAARNLAHGINPYTHYEPHRNLPYGPIGILPYLPLSYFYGVTGILITNAVLELGLFACLFFLGKKLASPAAGLLACAIYFSSTFVFSQTYVGINEPLLILLILLGLLYRDSEPAIAGFLMGLAVSTKIFPGLFFIPLILPRSSWRAYSKGLTLGLAPLLIAILLSPGPVLKNVFFAVFQQGDYAFFSWQSIIPIWLRFVVKTAIAALLAALVITAYKRHLSLWEVIYVGFCGTLLLLLAGYIAGNYHLWWLPLFALLLSYCLEGPRKELKE